MGLSVKKIRSRIAEEDFENIISCIDGITPVSFAQQVAVKSVSKKLKKNKKLDRNEVIFIARALQAFAKHMEGGISAVPGIDIREVSAHFMQLAADIASWADDE